MSFFDEPVPVEVGEDGLARSDWDRIHHLIEMDHRDEEQRVRKYPSISGRIALANSEARRLRVAAVWRKRMGYPPLDGSRG